MVERTNTVDYQGRFCFVVGACEKWPKGNWKRRFVLSGD